MRSFKKCGNRLRRLTPSTIVFLCLITSVALLTWGTTLSNRFNPHEDDSTLDVTFSYPNFRDLYVNRREVLENWKRDDDNHLRVKTPRYDFNNYKHGEKDDVRWGQQYYPQDNPVKWPKTMLDDVKNTGLKDLAGVKDSDKGGVVSSSSSKEDYKELNETSVLSSLKYISSALSHLLNKETLGPRIEKNARVLQDMLNSNQSLFSKVALINRMITLNKTLSDLLQDPEFTSFLHSERFNESSLGNILKYVGTAGSKDIFVPNVNSLVKLTGRDNNNKIPANDLTKNGHVPTDVRNNDDFTRLRLKNKNHNDTVFKVQTSGEKFERLSRFGSNDFGIKEAYHEDKQRERTGGETSFDVEHLSENQVDRRSTGSRTAFFNNIVVDGIFWSEAVENSIPRGVSTSEADLWIAKSWRLGFKSLQAPAWNKCGRPKNGFAVFSDGSEMCVRYRAPHDRLLQGEILSYWLARLMNLDNVPPVSLSSVDSKQWLSQTSMFSELGWNSGNHVALIMWITDIDSHAGSRVMMPLPILRAYKQRQPVDMRTLDFFTNIKLDNANTSSNIGNINSSVDQRTDGTRPAYDFSGTIVSLAQWGTLIIFDYLTGNYDRVASMQDGAERENKPSIIEESIRNLRKSKDKDKLWFIDNESGLLDAYDLLYRSPENGLRFVKFHNQMLQTMCVFQRRVVRRLQALHKEKHPHKTLEKYAMLREPLLNEIEKDSSYDLFEKYFAERLDTVIKWIHYCEEMARAR